ncbi:IDEAL domain-containing protein [Amycolatopsis palatopharyngis]|nr:IDEAL domain-containing protein [Amycolatopsis palatopharyngis]
MTETQQRRIRATMQRIDNALDRKDHRTFKQLAMLLRDLKRQAS